MGDITANITIRGADNSPTTESALNVTLVESGADMAATVELEGAFGADMRSFAIQYDDAGYTPARTRTLGEYDYNDAGTAITGERRAFQITHTDINRGPDSTVIKGELIPDKTMFVDAALDMLEARYANRFTDGERAFYPVQARWDGILKPATAIADAPGFWRHLHDKILEGSKPGYARLVSTLADYGLRIWRLDGYMPIRVFTATGGVESAQSVLLAPVPINRMAARRLVRQADLADFGLRLVAGPGAFIRRARTRIGATDYGFKATATLGNDPDPFITLDTGFDAHGLTPIPVADIAGFDHAGYTFWLAPLDHAAASLALADWQVGVGTFQERHVESADRGLNRRMAYSVPIGAAFEDDVDRYTAPLIAAAARAQATADKAQEDADTARDAALRTAPDTAQRRMAEMVKEEAERTEAAANLALADAEARAQPETLVYEGGNRTPGITLAEAQPDPYLGVIAMESERVSRYWRNHAAKVTAYANPDMRDGVSLTMPTIIGGGAFIADAVTTVIDPSGTYHQSLVMRGLGLPATPDRIMANSPIPFNGANYPAYWTPPETPSADFLTLDAQGTGAEVYDPQIDPATGIAANAYPLGGGFVLETATRTVGTGDARRQASPIIERTHITVQRNVAANTNTGAAAYTETVFSGDNEGWQRLINFADGLAGGNYRVRIRFANRWGSSPERALAIQLGTTERPTAEASLVSKIIFDQEALIPDSYYAAYAAAMADFDTSATPVSAQATIVASVLVRTLGQTLTGADFADIARSLSKVVNQNLTIRNWGFQSVTARIGNIGIDRSFILHLGQGRNFELAFTARHTGRIHVNLVKYAGGKPVNRFSLQLPKVFAKLAGIGTQSAGGVSGLIRTLGIVSRISRFGGFAGNVLSGIIQAYIAIHDPHHYGFVLTGTVDGKGRPIERIRVQYQQRYPNDPDYPNWNNTRDVWQNAATSGGGAFQSASAENEIITRVAFIHFAPMSDTEISSGPTTSDWIRFRVAGITELNRGIADDDAALQTAGDWTYLNAIRYRDYFGIWVNVVTAAVENTPETQPVHISTGAVITGGGGGDID